MGLRKTLIAALMVSALTAAVTPLLAATTPRASASGSARGSALSPAQRLQAVFAADARQRRVLDPGSALGRGEEVAPADFARLFTPALDSDTRALAQRSLAALRTVDRRKLSAADQMSYDVFAYRRQDELAGLTPAMLAATSVRPFNHFGGLHIEFPTLMGTDGTMPYKTEGDYHRNLALDRTFPRVLDNAAARFREGIASGTTESKLTVRNMIAQLDSLIAQKTEDSPFYSPILKFPATVPARARPALRQAYATAIRGELMPAYARFRAFLADEYLPAARDTVGLSEMRGGGALYRQLIAHNTTLPLTADAIHALGLSEVARIRTAMEGVKTEMGFAGPLHDFFDHVRSDPQYHPKTRAELAAQFAAIGRQVDTLIPQYFSRVPRTRLVIAPYPAYREKFEAGGSYSDGGGDGARPGTFYFNTYDLPSRFLTGSTTLYLHEGIPGHHFQVSLTLENSALPEFQRNGVYTAFVEGWALYAETLGYPMGLYRDPQQHWGTLDDEMLRAMRLVVDTGLHTKQWTRDRAIAYMLANSGMGRSDAVAEVERYIANPGQALSYKIGALTIQRLRDKAQAALGPRFDIRKFHAQVLDSGALPMAILEAKIDRWIAAGGG